MYFRETEEEEVVFDIKITECHPIRNAVHFLRNILVIKWYNVVTVEYIILLVKTYRQ
jgi:hypothetical protein